jgi:3-deoxy-D-manno-octulosonic-acid transferase
LNQRNIPTFLLAAQFRPSQIFFKPYGIFKRDLLKFFTFIFCQNKLSEDLLNQVGIHQHLLCGDNRYDRVYQTMLSQEELPLIKAFKGEEFLLIAGSAYINEASLIAAAIQSIDKPFKIIVAPHFVQAENIIEIEKLFG